MTVKPSYEYKLTKSYRGYISEGLSVGVPIFPYDTVSIHDVIVCASMLISTFNCDIASLLDHCTVLSCPVLYSAGHYDGTQYSTVYCSAAQHSTAQYDVKYSLVQ